MEIGDEVLFREKRAVVVEVVPPQGRPESDVPLTTMRPYRSYVVDVASPGAKQRVLFWPHAFELRSK
jgi:hypothetical protein